MITVKVMGRVTEGHKISRKKSGVTAFSFIIVLSGFPCHFSFYVSIAIYIIISLLIISASVEDGTDC